MTKPIVYHSFKEKEAIERELMVHIPKRRRRFIAKALMDIFHQSSQKTKSQTK